MQQNRYIGGILDGITTETPNFPETVAYINGVDKNDQPIVMQYTREPNPNGSGEYEWHMVEEHPDGYAPAPDSDRTDTPASADSAPLDEAQPAPDPVTPDSSTPAGGAS